MEYYLNIFNGASTNPEINIILDSFTNRQKIDINLAVFADSPKGKKIDKSAARD